MAASREVPSAWLRGSQGSCSEGYAHPWEGCMWEWGSGVRDIPLRTRRGPGLAGNPVRGALRLCCPMLWSWLWVPGLGHKRMWEAIVLAHSVLLL